MAMQIRQLTITSLYVVGILVAIPITAAPGTPSASSAAASADGACSALVNVDFSHVLDAPTAVYSAERVEANGLIPAYCLVKGYVTSHVGIELRLPLTNWNRKFLEVGCGGSCG